MKKAQTAASRKVLDPKAAFPTRLHRTFCAWILLSIIPMSISSPHTRIQPPESAGAWRRSDAPKRVNEKNIFEYMDGAGEMYVGYRFENLDVFNYQAPDREDILVELYWMKSSDDAFGLLSLDWSGEPVSLADGPSGIPQCLYAGGLLRIWSGSLFARIMTFPEIPESREAVLQIGRAIAAGRGRNLPPVFLNSLPAEFSGGWKIEKNKIGFLRSYLVLNSFYFISFSNILGLDLDCEAVCAHYRSTSGDRGAKPFFLLIIRYPNEKDAVAGMRSFQKAYFPEITPGSDSKGTFFSPVVVQTESGWSGAILRGRIAVLGFEWPDKTTAESVLRETMDHQNSTEDNHGP
jgi:hypothetical protein